MIPEFDYFKAQNLEQALQALADSNGKAKILAGGTDILPGFHINSRRFREINRLIDISGLVELKHITPTKEGLRLGSAVTFSELVKDRFVQQQYPLLAQAAAQIGSVQIRNRATLAGNFVNNAPCADSVPPMLVYDALIVVRSAQDERRLLLKDFLLKPYRTQLKPDELVTEIILPSLPTGYRGTFYKLGRRRGVAISRITLALLLRLQDGLISDLRIASGAVTPIGKRFEDLETQAKGQKPDPDLFKALAVKLGEHILQETGLRWSSAYKLPVVQQMFYQLLQEIAQAKPV